MPSGVSPGASPAAVPSGSPATDPIVKKLQEQLSEALARIEQLKASQAAAAAAPAKPTPQEEKARRAADLRARIEALAGMVKKVESKEPWLGSKHRRKGGARDSFSGFGISLLPFGHEARDANNFSPCQSWWSWR